MQVLRWLGLIWVSKYEEANNSWVHEIKLRDDCIQIQNTSMASLRKQLTDTENNIKRCMSFEIALHDTRDNLQTSARLLHIAEAARMKLETENEEIRGRLAEIEEQVQLILKDLTSIFKKPLDSASGNG